MECRTSLSGLLASGMSTRRRSMLSMSPKTKAQLAHEHLERARPAVLAEQYTEAVTWLFASLEAVIVAIAEQQGMVIEPKHWQKAEIAKQLYERGALTADLAPYCARSTMRVRRPSTKERSQTWTVSRWRT
jgi:hypothetical protein